MQGMAYHDTKHHLVSSQIISSSSYPIQDGFLAVPNNRLIRVALVLVGAFRMNGAPVMAPIQPVVEATPGKPQSLSLTACEPQVWVKSNFPCDGISACCFERQARQWSSHGCGCRGSALGSRQVEGTYPFSFPTSDPMIAWAGRCQSLGVELSINKQTLPLPNLIKAHVLHSSTWQTELWCFISCTPSFLGIC